MKKLTLLILSTLSFSTFATIDIAGNEATKLWNQIDLIGKIENVQIIEKNNNIESLYIDGISCVFEMYNACSFYVNTANERKMVVALEGTAGLMNQLAHIGIAVDEDNARMDVTSIDCEKEDGNISCSIEEYFSKDDGLK